ncbi:MAG: hypothetical protein O7G13_10275 [Alphaproteobacteria bacterium]|nr:hypothetical protein [Alphaproteobacteria bacterium]MCZ6839650.1 hypothetical protein [Alphaproteobacteria bacterium]
MAYNWRFGTQTVGAVRGWSPLSKQLVQYENLQRLKYNAAAENMRFLAFLVADVMGVKLSSNEGNFSFAGISARSSGCGDTSDIRAASFRLARC